MYMEGSTSLPVPFSMENAILFYFIFHFFYSPYPGEMSVSLRSLLSTLKVIKREPAAISNRLFFSSLMRPGSEYST